ncbi:MAG: VOC family protein [Pseudomonadota bacterium]
MPDNHGKVVWSELNTRDPVAAAAFFETVLGVSSVETHTQNGSIYRTLKKGDEMVAGILDISGPEFAGAPASWLTYLGCDDVDAACEAVKSAGGMVMSAPFDIPFVGRVAVIKDPTDPVVALMTPAAGGQS